MANELDTINGNTREVIKGLANESKGEEESEPLDILLNETVNILIDLISPVRKTALN